MMRREKKKGREGKTCAKIIIGHVTAYVRHERNAIPRNKNDYLNLSARKKSNFAISRC